jgi:hypothetical protein
MLPESVLRSDVTCPQALTGSQAAARFLGEAAVQPAIQTRGWVVKP